ncbi:MlaE family ABC transporter permease [Schleiferia thermophila]|uniref:Phospholipid/cholesterol/gamma-HCH transport system permease protein n=1 Tax=Schleiferia thermophila TaxID=884107 RepID=A0A368ZYX6_9FLAO|nr:ABC transporter permease [Schleiferia thermophila]KFD38227.1 ABC transporter permease [Schleiferia thermophila str. Yellowstone]RCX02161.1 phospholipid/cholesterol/gamma-HCH transport system permease protein [Schleiferia thermophila]
MNFYKYLEDFGRYVLMLGRVFRRPENKKMYFEAFLIEIEHLGINSLGLVAIISLFVGAVVTIQTALNLENPLIPAYYIAIATRESIILEFSPTMVSLILAGKVGSNIASTLGTMRVSEQIDALEVMGVNSASYLILPKIVAAVFFNPILISMSMFLGILGGFVFGQLTGMIGPQDFIEGLLLEFNPFYVTYALIKTVVFAFIITSVSAFHGYYVKGGAVEVGNSSTKAVVSSSLIIILANYILTQLILS